VTPEQNPQPEWRFALGLGRGLMFEGSEGSVEIPPLFDRYGLDGADKGMKLETIGRFDV